jgi:hypothetical protein
MVDANQTENKPDRSLLFGGLAGVCFLWAIVVTAILANRNSETTSDPMTATPAGLDMMTSKSTLEAPNTCDGAKLDSPDVACLMEALDDGSDVTEVADVVGPQAGGNVTSGYNGGLEVDVVPITSSYYQKGLCPVNVHWHLGAEHYSAGEYDCSSHEDHHRREMMEEEHHMCGPSEIHDRRKLAGKTRQGFQCNLYDSEDEKYTKPYEWKYCDKTMEVGQTYEVHWPHSAAGACGTPNQYQTPFYDGVFCNLPLEAFLTLQPQDIANAVGVQSQVFVIVNDDSYYYPDLIKGMIIEPELEMGLDVAIYTGSTTGTKRNNEICSTYSPITWQVDRKCHPISASSFDKMCADMMEQRDDMSDDLYAHGSRELVADHLVANNHANLRA